jgi:ABC-type glycerol-3-phosphate transport system permease component
MREKRAGLVLTFAYFFLVSGIISLVSVVLTLMISAFMGFSPLRGESLSQIIIMSYIPIGWTVISFSVFGILFFCSKNNQSRSGSSMNLIK